jgi:hypothetical protein
MAEEASGPVDELQSSILPPTADVERFVAAAYDYVAWFNVGTKTDMRSLHILLARLQAEAAALPDPPTANEEQKPDGPALSYEDARLRLAGLPFDHYTITHAPLTDNPGETVAASLVDDLTDIYIDLLDGFRSFDAGNMPDAIWAWRFTYYMHWGHHLTHAQTAIWQFVAGPAPD